MVIAKAAMARVKIIGIEHLEKLWAKAISITTARRMNIGMLGDTRKEVGVIIMTTMIMVIPTSAML